MANKQYWKTIAERDKAPEVLEKHRDEFGGSNVAETIASWSENSEGLKVNRKTFLKMAGFTLGATTLAGCRDQVAKIVPYLVRPEGVTPGVAYSYASTCLACPCGCGVLTKNRDGRPIKIEGNPDHPISRGGTCVIAQAEVMALYDSFRYQKPQVGGKAVAFKELDAKISEAFTKVRLAKGRVRVLSGTVNSPTLQRSINRFTQTFADAKHISYDSLSVSALADSYQKSHGKRFVPHYRFDKAEVILALDADFMGTWLSPTEFSKDYALGRKVSRSKRDKFSRHLQIESHLSLTGSNADNRWALRADQIPIALGHIVQAVAGTAAPSAARSLPASSLNKKEIKKIADQLKKAKGKSLVVSGINDPATQGLVNWLNNYLGNEGKTVEINRSSRQKLGSDKQTAALIAEILAGQVDALVVTGCNPAYDLPEGEKLAAAIKKIGLSISLASRPDETSALCQFVSPASHWLESWGDSEAVAGWVSPVQPTVERTTQSREDFVSFARFFGSRQTAYELMQQTWKEEIMPRAKTAGSFQKFWDSSLSKGVAITRAPQRVSRGRMSPPSVKAAGKGLELVLYPKVAIGDGRGAYNPYLQELADPISKIVWDNYAAMNPETAKAKGLERGDVITITSGGLSRDLPVLPQPGTPKDVVAVAVGYGAEASKRFHDVGPDWISKNKTIEEGQSVGQNVSVFRQRKGGYLGLVAGLVTIAKTGKKHTLAATQEYDSLHVPSRLAPAGETYRENIVQETTIAEIKAGRGKAHRDDVSDKSLYNPHEYPLHHWGLSVDMSACNGCSACVVACQIENNISIVGKDEVNRGRDMNWLRIDRYYADGAQEDGADIEVVHQPMMCQHCDNAPCEAVCPTGATQHSEEGLNDMAYNRCIGTRYCANNCPYKVRRFNWFTYDLVDPEYAQALNPDVTQRSRGVMEKCSMCVHRIEDARAQSKSEGRSMRDGDIQSACQQACPTDAIIFGDMADKNSRLIKLQEDARAYEVLEELNIKSAVRYHSVVRNPIPGTKTNEKKALGHG